MNASSSESHPVATNTDSRQATGQGHELTHVRGFFAAAGVFVPGGRGAGGVSLSCCQVFLGGLG